MQNKPIRYYEPYLVQGKWFFWIPEKDGPPGCTADIYVGPYNDEATAARQARAVQDAVQTVRTKRGKT